MNRDSSSLLDPPAEVPVDPDVAALPKADLHLQQEWSPRLDRGLWRRAGQPPYDGVPGSGK
ncbi:MAG TPA: hypothetical protein VGP82_15925 [Ktedonobacterales bacterium]|nr:hypothetical protein [Ktedonobacterales bacterium]